MAGRELSAVAAVWESWLRSIHLFRFISPPLRLGLKGRPKVKDNNAPSEEDRRHLPSASSR